MSLSAMGRLSMLTNQINKLSELYSKEQLKLSTGFESDYYSGLDSRRVESLSVRSKMNQRQGYLDTLSVTSSRLSVTDNILARMSELRSTTRNEMFEANTQTVDGGKMIEQISAENRLQEMFEHFNRKVGNRYIFGGAETNKPPTRGFDIVMNGDPRSGAAGFKDVMAEFLSANIGPSNTQADSIHGRLLLADDAAGNISLSEDSGVAHGYGMKILSVESLLTTVTATHNNEFDTAPVAIANAAADTTSANGVGAANLVAGEFNLTDDQGNTQTLTIGAGVSTSDVVNFLNDSGLARASLVGGNLQIEYGAGVSTSGTAIVGGGIFDIAANPQSVDSVDFAFTAQPIANNDKGITVRFTLGDDMEGGIHEITLYPSDKDSDNNNTFFIGASTAETATNFSIKLQERIEQIAKTELSSKAMFDAADAFFDIEGTGVPKRLDTTNGSVDPMDVTGALVDGDASVDATNNTVVWYSGDPTLKAGARDSVRMRIDDNLTISLGMQANEDGFVNFLKPLAVLASASMGDAYTAGDNDMRADLYTSIRINAGKALPTSDSRDSIDDIWQSISTKRMTINSTVERHQHMIDISKNILSDIELADTEEVAANLLTLQTQLEASYTTTSYLRNLTLTKYM